MVAHPPADARCPSWPTIRGKLTLVPVVNEAAFARGNRVAEDGLDLARTCPGRPDGSITERTAHALVAADSQPPTTTSICTPAAPRSLCFRCPATCSIHGPTCWKSSGRWPGLWPAASFGAPIRRLEGRSLSVARDANVPAIYCEYLGGGSCSQEGVEAYVAGCLNVMAWLGMTAATKSASSSARQAGPIVEDPRPNSGPHAAVLSGSSGGFLRGGGEVGTGDRGRTAAGLGRRSARPPAARSAFGETGLVLVLRTFPAVQQGDSLAVILEQPQ